MPPMKAAILPVTPLQQNCSLIWCTATNKAALVDPGGDLDRLKAGVAKAGVELKPMWETVRRGAFGRGAGGIHGLPDTWFKGDFDPDWERGFFAVRLMRKDVGLATQLARELDVPMPLANLAEQEMVQAINRGWGDDPTGKVRLLQEERAGVELRGEIPSGRTRLEIEE